jgi:hypothetical protein
MSSITNTRTFRRLLTNTPVSSDRPTNYNKPNEGNSHQARDLFAFKIPGATQQYVPPTQIQRLYDQKNL